MLVPPQPGVDRIRQPPHMRIVGNQLKTSFEAELIFDGLRASKPCDAIQINIE
jgi:hypothetical protein